MQKSRNTMHQKLRETLKNHDTIILVGGWTGGHIQPILNLLEKGGGIREANDGGLGKTFLWIWGKDSNEEKEAWNAKIHFKSIPTLKLSTTQSPRVLLYPLILVQWIMETRKILRSVIAKNEVYLFGRQAIQVPGSPRHESQKQTHSSWWREQICIFSKWWPGSVAVGIAAWSLGIPLYIHESDTIPGRSNRILGTFATKIFLGFESANKYFDEKKCEVTWQILGTSFAKEVPKGRRILPKKQEKISPTPLYKEGLSWKTDKPHLLVICWSQWARVIFEAILENFSSDSEYEWILTLGKLNGNMKKDFEKMNNTQVIEWISQEDIAYLLQNTDIAITRWSATTLAEIDTFWIRKIIIPLPYSSWNHQYWNAKEYEKTWDILLEQKNLNKLSTIIRQIWQNMQLSRK